MKHVHVIIKVSITRDGGFVLAKCESGCAIQEYLKSAKRLEHWKEIQRRIKEGGWE